MREEAERVDCWLDDLAATLATAWSLAARGRQAFDTDPAVPLAFEALSNRIGDLAKRLIAADAERFADPVWRQAARHSDFVVHRYDRLDEELLWRTVTVSFVELEEKLRTDAEAVADQVESDTPGR